jgi:hypothetical protein
MASDITACSRVTRCRRAFARPALRGPLSPGEHLSTSCVSIVSGAIGAFDHQNIDGHASGLQCQAKLFSKGGEERSGVVV